VVVYLLAFPADHQQRHLLAFLDQAYFVEYF
jgi:hypothetical protein